MSKISNFLKSKDFSFYGGMIIGTIIYCFGIVFILDLGEFYAGGITGGAQLITDLIKKFFEIDLVGVKSIFVGLLNFPLFLIAWKGVSKKFAFASLISVLMQMALIALFELMFKNGINPFNSIIKEGMNPGSMLCLAILGGLVTGAGQAICLKGGASTGGTDVISQYLSLTKQKSFVMVSFSIDFCIILVAAIFFEVDIAVYTIIRMIICTLTLDKLYTAYSYTKIVIITEEKQRLRDAIVSHINHGLTIYPATGGFSNKPKYVFEMIVWSFETAECLRLVKKVDPGCFVSTLGVKKVEGPFKVNVIA